MNRKVKSILLFIIFSLVLISLTTKIYAASFIPKISATDVKVGDTITITAKADNAAGMYNIKVGDSSILEVTSGSVSEFLENDTATIKLKAKKAGTTTVSVTPSDMTDLDDSTKPITTGGKTYTVKVTDTTSTTDKKDETTTNKDTTTTNKDTTTTTQQPKEKSNNAYLKTLGVRISDSLAKELGVKTDEYDFSGFSRNKTSYNVTVPKNVDSLKVIATAGENGTVKVSGNSGFEVGSNNKITIKVTSENGKTTKTYTIKVTQLAEEEEKLGNLIEDEISICLTDLKIDGIELSPEFSKDVYSYTAILDDSTINEVKVTAKANVEKAKIDISGNTELVEGENTINVLVTLENSTEQAVYQIVLTKAASEALITETIEEMPSSTTDLIGSVKKYIGIAIAVVFLIILAVIVLIILLRRENKKTDEDDEEYIEEEKESKAEEYNVYKNDENEFEDNYVERDNFIESLYRQRNGNIENEELEEQEKETLEEIKKETEKIFEEKVEGQSVEYTSNETYEENPLEVRKRRRGKGKHSL